MMGAISNPASFNSRRIRAASEESSSSRRTRRTRAEEVELFVSTVTEPMAILRRTLHCSRGEKRWPASTGKISPSNVGNHGLSRVSLRPISETFSTGERHAEGTVVLTQVQNREGNVLLTEGNSVFVSDTVKSRKFNIPCASSTPVCLFFSAQQECSKPRDEATGNYYRLPDQACCQNEMWRCPKRGQ